MTHWIVLIISCLSFVKSFSTCTITGVGGRGVSGLTSGTGVAGFGVAGLTSGTGVAGLTSGTGVAGFTSGTGVADFTSGTGVAGFGVAGFDATQMDRKMKILNLHLGY